MMTVTELSDPYANFMLSPLAPTAADVCSVCTTFTDGCGTCYPCGHQVAERAVDPGKFNPTADLDGESILLIDDTWTTGASVQSAAAALKTSGARAVGALVLGRHVNADYGENAKRLKALPGPLIWEGCALHQ